MGLCPRCERATLEPIIRSKPYVIIKEATTEVERLNGQLFQHSYINKNGYPENTSSYYLMKELGMAGVSMQSLTLSALWLHNPQKSKRTKDDKEAFQKCLDYSISEVIKVAGQAKIVMLMGAEVVRTFTGYGVSDVSGLVCKSDLLPNVPTIIPAPNPDKLMASPIGELRYALKTFAEEIKIYEAYSNALKEK